MPLPTDASLTCNFTIVSALNLSVSFQSGDTGNYGGQITLSTQGSEDPVTTQLWDNDGNVFFTIYATDPPASCIINSASIPGGWTPYIEVGTESGAYSTQTGHLFRRKLDSRSIANWTPVPGQTGHLGRNGAGLRLCFTLDGPSLSN